MKNILENIIIFRKDDPITFNIPLTIIIAVFLLLIFRNIEETSFTTALAISLWFILMIGINYIIVKVSKKYIVEIPNKKDSENDGYLLKTKEGEIFKMNENWMWSPGGELYKVKRGKRTDIVTFCDKNGIKREIAFSLFLTIGELISDKKNEEEIWFLIFAEEFNPITIYEIYKENNLEIIDNCLYIEDALKSSIIKFNLENKKIKKDGICFNDYFVENLAKNLWIPKIKGSNGCKIMYDKKFYPE